MPIYEYACQACDKHFEQLVRSMNGQTKVKCPHCGSTKTGRTVSVFAVSSQQQPSAYIPNRSDAATCGRCGGPPGSCATG